MNKKLIVFICILSLLVPFLPSFDFTLNALPYTPSESENSFVEDLVVKYQTYFGKNGVVANSDFYNTDYFGGLFYNIMDSLGFEPIEGDNYAHLVYDYSVTNNQTAEQIFNDSSSFVQNYVDSHMPYYIFRTMTCSEFLNSIPFNLSSINIERNYGYQEAYSKLQIINTKLDSSSVCLFRLNGNTFFSSGANYNAISKDDFLDNFMYCLNLSDFEPIDSKQYYTDGISPLNNYLPVSVWWCDGQSSLPSLTFDKLNNTTASYTANNTIFSNYAFAIPDNMLNGSVVLVPDSSTNFDYICFKSFQESILFGDGESPFYKFNPSVDLGGYGDEIDYSRLYDLISDSVSDSSGNIINSINRVANDYLKQQVDLLHDINNALNDGTGQSWLRRIYGILDYNFPLTLQAFDDLSEAIHNISVSGGGDFSEATRVLHEIDDKLGFLIEQPLEDATAQDFDELKSIAGTKFPFCIFSDIVAITVILNRTPRAPDINFPMPTLGSSSENVVHVDLTPYEYARPYVHGALIFLFVIGLMALSVKIFSALKG